MTADRASAKGRCTECGVPYSEHPDTDACAIAQESRGQGLRCPTCGGRGTVTGAHYDEILAAEVQAVRDAAAHRQSHHSDGGDIDEKQREVGYWQWQPCPYPD